MENKLQVLVKEQNMSESDVAKLVEAFGGPFNEAGVVLESYKDIIVTDVDDISGMARARESRLLLKKARTTIENKRKELKADIVKQGRAIDSVARLVKEEIEPAEEYLELQEKFADIKKAEIAAALKADRVEQLLRYTNDISLYNLDTITTDQFDALLSRLKSEHEAEELRKAEEAKAAEEARLAEEKRIAEQAKENERLKKEAEAAKAEQAKRDAEALAERQRIQKEADEKLAIERAQREKLEQEKRDRESADRKIQAEKERADREAREAEESKQRAEMLAPDKQKLINLAHGIDAVRQTKLPAVSTNQAQKILDLVDTELANLHDLIIEEANKL